MQFSFSDTSSSMVLVLIRAFVSIHKPKIRDIFGFLLLAGAVYFKKSRTLIDRQ